MEKLMLSHFLKLFVLLIILIGIVSCGSDEKASDDTDDTSLICANAENLYEIETNASNVIIAWEHEEANSFTVEYGAFGFDLGTGIQVNVSEKELAIDDLEFDTGYSFYVRTNCDNNEMSEFFGPENFMTRTCFRPIDVNVWDVLQTTARITWNREDDFDYGVELEFGPSGFEIGEGDIFWAGTLSMIQINGLTKSTNYDLYLRSTCGQAYSDDTEVVQFLTEGTCLTPIFLQVRDKTETTINFEWDGRQEDLFRVEWGEVGFELGTGNTAPTTDRMYNITGLQSNTDYEIYVRSLCGNAQEPSNYSEPLFARTD
jgi:hypothetical protein